MTNLSVAPWEQLFPPKADAGAIKLRFRLVRKRSDPLLLLPMDTQLAKTALALYPAQTGKARIARGLLRAGLSLAPSLVTESLELATDATSALPKFLAEVAATTALPRFAVFLGNPRAPGRRFVLLLFNNEGNPAALVKAGTGEQANSLIAAELNFLKSQPAELLSAPKVQAECSNGGLRAFAMDYVAGTAPGPEAATLVDRLMNAWLRPAETLCFGELPVARRLNAVVGNDPAWETMLRSLSALKCHPAIHHGDFAPWNIRVDPAGKWRVLDWERGEALGPPAWDWFHWLIQYEVLVRHTATEDLSQRVEALLTSAPFESYAARAGIDQCVRPLLIAYLLYCCRVIRQADGLPRVEALLKRMAVSIPRGN
jgi:hypothetical protein